MRTHALASPTALGPVRIAVESYLRLTYQPAGRARPAVDCWGLYRLIIGETQGLWLGEFSGLEEPLAMARTAQREAAGGEWLPIAAGDERPGDAVLLRGLLGEGRSMLRAPIHIGCVIEPGRMIDIEAVTGVTVRAYRATSRWRADQAVANRLVGLFRPRALA